MIEIAAYIFASFCVIGMMASAGAMMPESIRTGDHALTSAMRGLGWIS